MLSAQKLSERDFPDAVWNYGVMSPVTIAVAVVVALAVLVGIWLFIVSAAKKDVRNTSEILAGVEEVNQGYG